MKWKRNYQGGLLSLSSGSDWEKDPGATVFIRSSSFESNGAECDDGGVMHLADFTHVDIEGDDNVFENNSCSEDGAVVAATTNTCLNIQGGVFVNNTAKVGPFRDW